MFGGALVEKLDVTEGEVPGASLPLSSALSLSGTAAEQVRADALSNEKK